jgi:hydrogenase maturation protease
MADILIIGYGNELRSDDGAGPAVARYVESLRLPGVRTLVLPQLTPELAADIACARAVIFVDAQPAHEAHEVQVLLLSPSSPRALGSHTSDPGALLALTQALYGRCPPTWLVAVPAARFDLGTELSPLTQAAVGQALERIRALCASVPTERTEA